MPKITLNANQKKAVQHKSGPLLVVAGAGTGKTRVITERIKHLIQEENNSPKEILALTFTDKAATEMLERIGDIMPLGYEEPWVSTFHSFADRVLRTEGLEIGIDPSYKILSYPEQWLLLRKNIFDFELEYFRPLGNPTKFISAILKFISRLQDENVSPEEFTKFAKDFEGNSEEKIRWNELAHIFEKYTELKLAHSKFDFGDLIIWTIRLFQERQNILDKYQKQFNHVLVDEFQDTNYAQYELVKLLCPQKMKERSLLVVGDDSQSIYKFRGAAVSNILDFMKDYPDAEMISLLDNYRSTQEILDPAYKLITNNNPDTLESKLGISKELESKITEKGPRPEIIRAETLEDEVGIVIAKIYEILAKEPQYTYKDFAILARANNHLDPFVLALRKYGLPYQLVGNRGLYDRDEIRDIFAFLKVIINPDDSISLYRAMNIQTLEIPYEEVSDMLAASRKAKVDLWEMVKSSREDHVVNFYRLLTEFQKNITKSTPVELVYTLVSSIHYLEQFIEHETVENQLCIKNLDLFLQKVQQFEVSYHDENKVLPTVIDLVDYLELVIEAGENPAQAQVEDIDTINLMTTHASKGLEFPVVFVVNTVANRFPTRNRSDPIMLPDEVIKETLPTGDEHIQEERRLFYVAMTRAKKYLYMTLGKNYGGKRDTTPSGFLDETQLKIKDMSIEDIGKGKEQTSLFGVESGFREPGATKITDFKPRFFSYSQYNMYKTCPLKYKYSYVLNIPTPPSHALSFGITIHDTLRDFHQKQLFEKNVSLSDLLEMYKKNWQPLGYMDEQHRQLRFESGEKLLTDYYERHKNDKNKPLALEKSFNVFIGGTKFFGRIDRIDKLSDGGVEIIDYKTGNPKTQKEVDKDEQVTFYAIAAKEALGMNPELLSLYFVESGEKFSTTRTAEQLQEKKEEVSDVLKQVGNGDFKANPGMQCTWCDYKDICPFANKAL